MALQLKLARTGIDSVGTKMYLQDATGDYHVDDNPGGWGAPNPERVDRAVLVQAFNRKSTASDEAVFDPYDPETVDKFTLNCTADGYYEIFIVSVPKTTPTAEGEYGWDAIGGLVGFKDGAVVAATPEEVYNEPLYTEATSFKTVLLARVAIHRNTKNLELVKLLMAHHDDRGHNRDIADAEDHFNTVRTLLEGARYMWCQDNYTEAQRIVESFNEVIDE